MSDFVIILLDFYFCPYWESIEECFWGETYSEQVYYSFKMRGNSRYPSIDKEKERLTDAVF